MQHRVVQIVVSAHLLQLGERSLEREPFADAQVQLSFFLHLLENQEEIPITEVLHAGDAVRQRVVDGQFSAAAAFFGSWAEE